MCRSRDTAGRACTRRAWAAPVVAAAAIGLGLVRAAAAQPEGSAAGPQQGLAQQLQNPLAAIINVPFQNNFDLGAGPRRDGLGYTLNFQPVVPFRLSDDWTLISRTIVPFLHQERYGPTHEGGLGDVTQSLFFSPRVARRGLTLGFGPVLYLPTATNDALASRQWGAGPTVVAVQQSGPWTFGLLANHIWGFAQTGGLGERERISQSFLQPFVSRNFRGGFALLAQAEASYDWTGSRWTIPVGVGATQLVHLGDLPVNLGLQGRYWAARPDGAPEWGIRLVATLVLR